MIIQVSEARSATRAYGDRARIPTGGRGRGGSDPPFVFATGSRGLDLEATVLCCLLLFPWSRLFFVDLFVHVAQ